MILLNPEKELVRTCSYSYGKAACLYSVDVRILSESHLLVSIAASAQQVDCEGQSTGCGLIACQQHRQSLQCKTMMKSLAEPLYLMLLHLDRV